MSTDGQGTKRLRTNAGSFNRLSRVHERYTRQTDGQTTDGRVTAYSERDVMFANNLTDRASAEETFKWGNVDYDNFNDFLAIN